MHRLFGKSKPKEPGPSLDDATGSLNNRIAEVDLKIKGLDKELMTYKEQLKKAKGPAANNIKRRAMETLKRKRMYETQRDQMSAQCFNVEQTSFAIETVKSTQTTVSAMKDATKTLKIEQKKINLNDLENMQDDLEDLLEDTNEISDILGRSYGIGDEIDEGDLEAELAGLEEELEGEDLELDTPAYLQPLPQQPNAPIDAKVSQSEGAIDAKKSQADEYGLPVQLA